jgi:hypothetical protein
MQQRKQSASSVEYRDLAYFPLITKVLHDTIEPPKTKRAEAIFSADCHRDMVGFISGFLCRPAVLINEFSSIWIIELMLNALDASSAGLGWRIASYRTSLQAILQRNGFANDQQQQAQGYNQLHQIPHRMPPLMPRQLAA